MSIRTRVLNRVFSVLYGPLVFLHEPAGTCLFGMSWHGRRINLLQRLQPDGLVLDVGCGSGHLAREIGRRGFTCVGIDPSRRMLARAIKKHGYFIRARADALPLANSTAGSVVCTYPGAWIRDAEVWNEASRVLAPGGSFIILLGGTVTRGRGSRVRACVTRIMYGNRPDAMDVFEPPEASQHGLTGRIVIEEDSWGTVYRWEGTREPV